MSKVSNSGDSKKRKGESERRDDLGEGGAPTEEREEEIKRKNSKILCLRKI